MALVEAFVATGLVKGRNEARRALKEGGVYVNNVKQDDEERVLGPEDVLAGRHVLLRRGKRNLAVVSAP